MKKILYIAMAAVVCLATANCTGKEWKNGDPSMEHVYYVAFEEWFNKTPNNVVYNVERGATVEVPIQFHSERTRSYDVVTYYWATSEDLAAGTDYQIVDAKGTVLTADAKGAFTLDWPRAVKGVQKVYLKALSGAAGSVTLHTFDPAAGAIAHPDNITNSKTADYEVRAISQNYKVKVNVK